MLRKEITEYLKTVNEQEGPLTSEDIAKKIREVIKKEDIRSIEDEAEIFAFNVYTDTYGSSSWNSYFGPMMSFPGKTGTPIDFPSREIISDEVLDYWEARLHESHHPLLRSNYADLLIEFSKLTGRKVKLEFAQASIEGHMQLIKRKYVTEIDSKDALQRALSVAKKFGQKDAITEILSEAVKLEKEIGKDDDKPGLWGFVIDWFVLDPDIQVPTDIEEASVTEMVAKHRSLLSTKNVWPLKAATIHLADYYKAKGDLVALKTILNEYEKVVVESEDFKEGSMGQIHYLRDLDELYSGYNVSDEIKSDISRIKASLKKFRIDPTSSDFKEISVEVSVPREQIDTYIDGLFKDKGLIETAGHIAHAFIIRKERDRKTLEERSKKFVFAHLVTGDIFDQENRLIARIPTIDEAPEAHLRKHSSENLEMGSVFLANALSRFTKTYAPTEFADLLLKSAPFSGEDRSMVEKILKSYWEGDYFTFTHTCTPFVEAGIRKLLIGAGMSVTKENSEGGYDYRSLNSLLGSEQAGHVFQQIFRVAGDDVLYTLKITLIDPLGQNIRNRVAHGIHQVDFFNRRHSDNLFKTLLVLGNVKEEA